MMTNQLNHKEIFNTARKITDSAVREEYLENICGNDPDLLSQVRELLRLHEQDQSFLENPPLPLDITQFDTASERVGSRIGPYKLMQQLGEGGMGTVYLAEQSKPIERQVALKIIKAGMDSQQIIARFEAERQALAMMDHPNIAKVLDAGKTDDGRPYFVMELVKGTAITQYCDEQQLTPRERLELFMTVCQAVQHAHQKGIIHRDLKPSNILIAHFDDQPNPKVIDFGVAKAINQKLTEKTIFTQHGQILGTLEYMSPEQARFNQLDVDTRSDIYSLGVLLYELLTGETPFDKKRLRSAAFEELVRILREEEPPRPSARLSTTDALPAIAAKRNIEPRKLSTIIRGELDWIVMKALEKDRKQRYATPTQLAEDIQRFLNHEQIMAYPVSPLRRLWRWYGHHVSLLAATYTMLTFFVLATMQVGLLAVWIFVLPMESPIGMISSIFGVCVWLAIAAFGVSTGMSALKNNLKAIWLSLGLFSLFSLMAIWGFVLSIATVRRTQFTDPFVATSVIGYAVLGLAWMLIGVLLQIHVLVRARESASQ